MAITKSDKFLANRLKYHTASRVGAQTGYSLAQSLDPDGHIMRSNSVWTAPNSQFPMNISTSTDGVVATEDLVNVFKTTGTATSVNFNGTDTSDGLVWRNTLYPAVELYENVTMTGVANSDGADSNGKFQSYEVSKNGKRVLDWIAPTAVINEATSKPQAGYTGIVEAQKSGTWKPLQQAEPDRWELAAGTWEFVYFNGMLIFDPNQTPLGLSYTGVRITAFRYVGEKLEDTLSGMSTDTANNMMAIKPFVFSAYNMQPVSTMGGETDLNGNSLQKTIPGIVLNVFNNDTGIAYGDVSYDASTGYSTFYIEDGNLEGSGIDATLNGTTFTAYAFVLATGSPITVLPSETLL